jgi:hypothetical protein
MNHIGRMLDTLTFFVKNHKCFSVCSADIFHFSVGSGIMKIGQECISLAAHLSNKACKMVQELSRSLPPVMKVTKYPKVKAYPSRWEQSEPTAESIGLYFFSDNMWCVDLPYVCIF